MDLSSLKKSQGSTKNRKRVGRGEASGNGLTAGRGQNGQRSRSGSKQRAWFEGGQMPIQRRLPKFGFYSYNRKDFQVVNLSDLVKKFDGKATVTPELLSENGLVKTANAPIKILGDGEVKVKLTVEAHAFSKSAQEKIEKAGGTVKAL